MTVLLREELNEADLAWAAASALVDGAMGPRRHSDPIATVEAPPRQQSPSPGRLADPPVLPARAVL